MAKIGDAQFWLGNKFQNCTNFFIVKVWNLGCGDAPIDSLLFYIHQKFGNILAKNYFEGSNLYCRNLGIECKYSKIPFIQPSINWKTWKVYLIKYVCQRTICRQILRQFALFGNQNFLFACKPDEPYLANKTVWQVNRLLEFGH